MIEVIRGEKQIGKIAARWINPTIPVRWRQEFDDNASQVLDENKREQELLRTVGR